MKLLVVIKNKLFVYIKYYYLFNIEPRTECGNCLKTINCLLLFFLKRLGYISRVIFLLKKIMQVIGQN